MIKREKLRRIVESRRSGSKGGVRKQRSPLLSVSIHSSRSVASTLENASRTSTQDITESTRSIGLKGSVAYFPDLTESAQSFKDFIQSFHPLTIEKGSNEFNERYIDIRKSAFKACDIRRTGNLSLPDIESFVLLKLKRDHGERDSEIIFNAFMPSYRIAYDATKAWKSHILHDDGDFISFQHFRLLNVFLCVYAGMCEVFTRLTGEGSQEKGLNRDRWNLGRQKLRSTGFVAFDPLYEDSASFDGMKQQNGYVHFQDFCEWIKEAEIVANTELGEKLSIIKGTRNESIDDTSLLRDSSEKKASFAKSTEERNELPTSPSQESSSRKNNSLKKMASDIRSENHFAQKTEDRDQPEDKASDSDTASTTKETNVGEPNKIRPAAGRSGMTRMASLLVVNDMVADFRVPHDETPTYQAKGVEELSEGARMALVDFNDHLHILNKDALDEEGFNTILDDMGYSRDRTGLFDDLLSEFQDLRDPRDRSKVFQRRQITLENLLALYSSESYHLLDNGTESGDALMKYIDEIFNDLDLDDNGYLDRYEITVLLHKLTGKPPTEDQIFALFDVLDTDGSETIDREEFKFIVLKPNKNEDVAIPESFNYNLFDPALVSIEDFIKELENYCSTHKAVEHHFLKNLAGASFGREQTLDMLLRFFVAQYSTSSNNGFNLACLDNLSDLLEEREHLQFLEKQLLIEEMGVYSDEMLVKIESMGISRQSVVDVPHSELFSSLVKSLEQKLRCSYRDFVPESILSIQRDTTEEVHAGGLIGSLAAYYFGSELILPKLYNQLLQGLQNSSDLSKEDARFLVLNSVIVVGDKLNNLRTIVTDVCHTKEDRINMFKYADKVLHTRVKFYDAMRDQCDFRESKQPTKVLYNEQASVWKRNEPICLADFTSNPTIFKMCEEHVKGAELIDIGCGEGYLGRRLVSMGARKLIGVDISNKMIEGARKSSEKSPEEHYIVGDAVELKTTLLAHSAELNLMLGAQFETGVFDVAVAAQLFNSMTIAEMNSTLKQVYSLLKPGGHFVFSVPHPSRHHRPTEYFSLCDKQIKVRHKMVNGKEVDSWNYFKVFENYINATKQCGFTLTELKETRISPEDLLQNPAFFKDFIDQPLFLVIKVRKPGNISTSATLNNATSIDLLPKKLTWNKTMLNNFANVAQIVLPEAANAELCDVSLRCYRKGLDAESIEIGRDVDPSIFKVLKPFCKRIRAKLLHQTGAVIVKGLDMNKLGGVENLEQMTACSKIAYALICSHIGTIDSGARGRLFDVKSKVEDVVGKKRDNVLFSVSDSEAGWHTDGASKDRVYDVVGLMCISPAAEGGKFRFANACNVFNDLSEAMPKFFMYELTRSLPRDVLENGRGLGSMGMGTVMSRASDVLAMRIRYNSYPIYVAEGDRMRFRYMRYWIETGHAKTGWKVPTFLRIAMDLLDDKLDKACVFHEALERGDIIFANNAMLAHARDSFKNGPGLPPRHKVRAWLQIQKADILEFESDQVNNDLRGVIDALKNTSNYRLDV